MKNPKLLIVPFDSTCFAILELTRAQYIYIYIYFYTYELVVSLKDPSFLGKALWKVGARLPREYCARGNHSLEDKL